MVVCVTDILQEQSLIIILTRGIGQANRINLTQKILLIIGLRFKMQQLMFDFHPKILYIYMVTWIQASSGNEQILLVTPYYDKNIIYKNIPPIYNLYDTIEATKYSLTFDSVTTEYDYIDFGRNKIAHRAVSRSNYPNRIRYYSKGKLVNNTFSWYSYYEEINKNDVIISAGDGNPDYQLNYSQSDYYRKYYWICV